MLGVKDDGLCGRLLGRSVHVEHRAQALYPTKWKTPMSANAVIRMPGEGKELQLAGKPLAFLVTGQDSKHTCMFDPT